MKNKITLLGCLFFAFGIADAAEFTSTYNSDGGHRTTLSGLSKNIDAVLNSTPNEAADSGIYYRGGFQTMKSMTVVDRTSTPEVAAMRISLLTSQSILILPRHIRDCR